jgi:hypothetical protein
MMQWLRRPEFMLVLVGLVLPNIAFLALSMAGISVPPRTLSITLYLLAAASLRYLPSPLVVLLFVAALAFDIMFCATRLFGLTLTEALFALQFIHDLDILSSKLYVVLIVTLLGVFGLVFYLLLRHARTLRLASWIPMLVLALIVIPADIAINTPGNAASWLNQSSDESFESAMINSGFTRLVKQPNGHHMLVVIVEAMGHFADPAQQKLLRDAIQSSAIGDKYNVTEGMSSFVGGTTSAEMREFCGTRNSYLDYLAKPRLDCVPFRMGAYGYATTGYHGFSGEMFNRAQWWPHIGFQHKFFGEDLYQPGEQLCGSVFIGICDPALVTRVAQQIKQATLPQFDYLLTVNTHIPVLVDQGYKHLDCSNQAISRDAPIPEREVCIMTDAWIELLQTIAREWSAPDMPPTEILIVGDHAPPLWYRKARDLFTPGEVTWFRLSPKSSS